MTNNNIVRDNCISERETGRLKLPPGFKVSWTFCCFSDARGLGIAGFSYSHEERTFSWEICQPLEPSQAMALFKAALQVEREEAALATSIHLIKARNQRPSDVPSPPLPGRIQMAKLANTARRRAELTAELAQVEAQQAGVFDELAEGTTVDLRTGRRQPRKHVPQLPEPSELDRAKARAALRPRRGS